MFDLESLDNHYYSYKSKILGSSKRYYAYDNEAKEEGKCEMSKLKNPSLQPIQKPNFSTSNLCLNVINLG